jgi:hypothetical protein
VRRRHEHALQRGDGVLYGDDRCRLVWTIDLLPNELAPTVDGLASTACEAMKRTLEA